MFDRNNDAKSTILTDMLISFNNQRAPLDARFARAHEIITGLDIFPRPCPLITFAAPEHISSESMIKDIASTITNAINGIYRNSPELASNNDIVHLPVNCENHDDIIAALNIAANRNVDFSLIIHLYNPQNISSESFEIISTAITDMTLNGQQLNSVFFINTIDKDLFESGNIARAQKIIDLGFVVKGE